VHPLVLSLLNDEEPPALPPASHQRAGLRRSEARFLAFLESAAAAD
jgi:hypothetical protein